MAVANPYFQTLNWVLPNVFYYGLVLYRAKWFILVITFFSALAGVGKAVTARNVYQATVVVTPAERDSRLGTRALGRAASLFVGLGGGLADALEVTGSSQREALAALKSRDFWTYFAEKRQRTRKLRQPSEDDPDAPDRAKIREPPLQHALKTVMRTHSRLGEWISEQMKTLIRKVYEPPTFQRDVRQQDIPDSENFYRRIRRSLAIERKPREGLVNVKVRWKDPRVAAEWANAVIADLNTFLRETATAEARQRIAYLNRELDKTSVIQLQKAIYNLIEAETRTIMVAETRVDYAFKVIDPAMPPSPDRPIRPKRLRLIWTTTLMGFAIATCTAILLHYLLILREQGYLRMLREQGEGNPAAR